MSYKISVIIPVFNVEEYIGNAFQSILLQTIGFENLEIIFVDDCSTDNSRFIIDKYADEYDNVISVHLDVNSGVAGKPRNIGMAYASGDYLMFLDPDDVFTIDACEILFNKITEHEVDIAGGLISVRDNNGLRNELNYVLKTFTDINDDKKTREKKANKILNNPNFELKLNSYKDLNSIVCMFHFFSKIFRRKFILDNNIKFAEFAPAEDSIFLLDAIFHAKGMVFVNNVIVEYFKTRDGENKSVTHQISKKRLFERIGVYYKMYHLSRTVGEKELFIKYLLINKLNYFLTDHLLLSRLSNDDLRETLEFVSPLFAEALKFKEYIPYNLKLFKLISKDIDGAISEIKQKINRKRSNNIISIVININGPLHNLNFLENIFSQTYDNLQIICIIDKENQSAIKSLEKYSNDSKVLIVENDNKTWVYKGLEYAIGYYIHFINTNNYFDNSFYENIISYFNKNDVDMVLCDSDNYELNNLKQPLSDFDDLSLIFNASPNLSNQIYKTTFIEEYFIDIFKYNVFFEDIFCYNYYINSRKTYFSKDIVYNSTNNRFEQNFDFLINYLSNLKIIINLLKKQDNYDLYEQDIWYNIIFKVLAPFKVIERKYFKEYYFELCDFFEEYDLSYKNFKPQLELWLILFKKKNYTNFINNYELYG